MNNAHLKSFDLCLGLGAQTQGCCFNISLSSISCCTGEIHKPNRTSTGTSYIILIYLTVFDLTGPDGWRSSGAFASNPPYVAERSKLVLCNWQQYSAFKWLLYVPLNRSVSPLCTASIRHWNCEWEDIVLEHDRNDYISCMWWFMRDNTDTFVPRFNKHWEMLLTCLSLQLCGWHFLCRPLLVLTNERYFVVKSMLWWISVVLKRCIAYHK